MSAPASGKVVRFAVVAPDLLLPRWFADAVTRLVSVSWAQATLVVDHPAVPTGETAFGRRRRGGRRDEATEPVAVADTLPGVPCRSMADPGTATALRRMEVDLVLGEHDTPTGRALAAGTSGGLWCFDLERPVGVREILERRPVTRAALVRPGRHGGEREVLFEGVFPTITDSPARNREQVLGAARDWPRRAAAAWRLDASPPGGRARVGAASAPAVSGVGTALRLGARTAVNALRRRAQAVLWSDQWSVGVVEAPIQDFLDGPKPPVRWLDLGARNRCFADPFAITDDAGTHVVLEEFEHRTGEGRLAAVDLADGAERAPTPVAIDIEGHTSYPYLFRHDGRTYCVPETGAARRVSLFSATAFPRRWAKVADLVTGFAATDPTVFRHDGLWWLLCSEFGGAPGTSLLGWYATALEGPWTAHPLNPLKTDCRSSRPAGTPFVVDGALHRPAQDCGRTYGGGITINRVEELGPTAFREVPVQRLDPYADRTGRDGLHTLAAAGAVTLVDGKRHTVVWPGVRRQLRTRWQRAGRTR